MILSFGKTARRPIALSRQFQVCVGSLPGLILKRMQYVHCILELGGIDHPERASLVTHPDLARA
jgi:hypothetical protein